MSNINTSLALGTMGFKVTRQQEFQARVAAKKKIGDLSYKPSDAQKRAIFASELKKAEAEPPKPVKLNEAQKKAIRNKTDKTMEDLEKSLRSEEPEPAPAPAPKPKAEAPKPAPKAEASSGRILSDGSLENGQTKATIISHDDAIATMKDQHPKYTYHMETNELKNVPGYAGKVAARTVYKLATPAEVIEKCLIDEEPVAFWRRNLQVYIGFNRTQKELNSPKNIAKQKWKEPSKYTNKVGNQ